MDKVSKISGTFSNAIDSDIEYLKKEEPYIHENVLKRKILDGEIYIAWYGKKPIGILRYGLFWDEIPFLNMLRISKNFRGRGIGRQFVLWWEGIMKEKGFTSILTSSMGEESAKDFYKKIGYKKIGKFAPSENGGVELFFEKIL